MSMKYVYCHRDAIQIFCERNPHMEYEAIDREVLQNIKHDILNNILSQLIFL